MKKRIKGFTLLELLAVIVVLAIILLIVVPIVLNVIGDSKKGAFESSAMGLIKTAENECLTARLNKEERARLLTFPEDEDKLYFSGEGPEGGQIRVHHNCRVEIAIHNGEWCARKTADENEVTLTPYAGDCSLEESFTNLNSNQLMCLIHNECEGVVLPDLYVGTEGLWLPIASRLDLENISADGPAEDMIFAEGTIYQKLWNDAGYGMENGRFEQRYIVVNSFEMGSDNFISIAYTEAYNYDKRAFCGIFDGNFEEINGLTSNSKGLFHFVEATDGSFSRCKIRNIGLTNLNINSIDEHVGGLVGLGYDVDIINSYVTGSVYSTSSLIGGLVGMFLGDSIISSYSSVITEGDYYIGGLVGMFMGDSIISSYATGDVNGDFAVGGLVGDYYGITLINSYATGNVVATSSWVGGLIGGAPMGTSIKNSYAMGDVEGQDDIGGLIGYSNTSKLINSYAMGNVAGESRVGGLIGSISPSFFATAIIMNSYAIGNVAGESRVGGLIGSWNGHELSNVYALNSTITRISGTSNEFGKIYGWRHHTAGEPTTAFANETMNFSGVEEANVSGENGEDIIAKPGQSHYDNNGWDFVNIWSINENDYPIISDVYSVFYADAACDPSSIQTVKKGGSTVIAPCYKVRHSLVNYSKIYGTGNLNTISGVVNNVQGNVIIRANWQEEPIQVCDNGNGVVDGILTDTRDGNTYGTVKINPFCFMAENLAYLPEVHSNIQFQNQGNNKLPGYGVHGYNGSNVAIAKAQSNYAIYGVLYNWHAVNQEGASSICPAGWRVPTHEEIVLFEKSNQQDWLFNNIRATSPDWNGNNYSGFTALPAGVRNVYGNFSGSMNPGGYWWSSSSANNIENNGRAHFIGMDSWNSWLYSVRDKEMGKSVRCIRD